MPRKRAGTVPVTKKVMVERMELIQRLFLAAASATQNAADYLRQDRPWRTDDLADGADDGRAALEMLRELL